MIEVKFKNLEKSELAKDVVNERLETLIAKFEDLETSKISVTLEMENSPIQAGPDVFKVKIHISNGRYRGTTVTKSDANLYKALAEISDHMLEKLNRAGDKERVRERARARQLQRKLIKNENLEHKIE